MKRTVFMVAVVAFTMALLFVPSPMVASADEPELLTADSIDNAKVRNRLVKRFARTTPGFFELEFDFGGALILVTGTGPGTAVQSLDDFGGAFNGSFFVQMTDPNQSFKLKEKDFIRFKHDGKNTKICLPNFNVVSGTSTELFVDTEGNTYFDSDLTVEAGECDD